MSPASSKIASTIVAGLLQLFPAVAFATDKTWNCPSDLKVIARELLELELSGLRLHEKSSCLDPSRFKYVQVFHDPSGEDSLEGPELLPDKAVVTIDRVVENTDAEEQIAFFTIVRSPGTKPEAGSFRFVFHKSELRRKKDGCADLLGFPESWKVWSRCASLQSSSPAHAPSHSQSKSSTK